jgi:hypothetical protein
MTDAGQQRAMRRRFSLAAARFVTTGLGAAIHQIPPGPRTAEIEPAALQASEPPLPEALLPALNAIHRGREAEPQPLEAPGAPEREPEPEPAWNFLSPPELELEPVAASRRVAQPLLVHRRSSERRSRAQRPGLALAAAAWMLTSGAIGAAAVAVIQHNPPQRSASVRKVSQPLYSYYAPVQAPSGGTQPNR